MANFSKSTYHLVFDEAIPAIVVRDSDNVVAATFSLGGSNAVQVSANTTHYVLDAAESFATAVHRLDVNGGTTISFEGNRMGGTGLMDLRDMGRQDELEIGYHLDQCPITLRHVPGSFDLWVLLSGTDCYSVEP